MAAQRKARKVRAAPSDGAASSDIYDIEEPKTATFSTGCTLLNCVLGGGWAYSRVANIIGDKSTGKTLLAIEACANFALENPTGKIVYVEAEAAFDEDYAESLGLPLGRVEFPDGIDTVEDVFEDLDKRMAEDVRTLYIIDSFDALSDRDEAKRAIDQGSYGQSKQKKTSELFRRMIQRFKRSNVTLLIISQVRDAIGVAFGDKLKRSGGRALDFYATHALWLAHLGQIKKTSKGVQRTVGVRVKAQCKKNKVGPAFRSCEFPLLFGYGVEDLQAGLDWLVEVKRTDSIGMSLEDAKKLSSKVSKLTDEEYEQDRANVINAVKQVWMEIENGFKPRRRKYR
tara:strand:+ start:1687 stop:2709 length:1023 start_codon:yes stop_codon:yes gene_type:complete